MIVLYYGYGDSHHVCPNAIAFFRATAQSTPQNDCTKPRGIMKTSFLLFPILIGCLGNDSPENTTNNVVPNQGTWTVDSSETIIDSCGFFGEDEGEDSQEVVFDFNQNDNGGYTFATCEHPEEFTINDGEAQEVELSCDVLGNDLICADNVQEENLKEDGIDAIANITTTLSGAFDSSSQLNGTMSISINCEGDDCNQLTESGFQAPCEIALQFSSSFDSSLDSSLD